MGVEFYVKRTVLQGNRHVTLKVNTIKLNCDPFLIEDKIRACNGALVFNLRSCNLNLKIWDIGGAGALQGNMLDKYAFGAHAIMLVYDVTNGASFDQLAGKDSFVHTVFNIIFG